MLRASLPHVIHWGWRGGGSRPPFDPPRGPRPGQEADSGSRSRARGLPFVGCSCPMAPGSTSGFSGFSLSVDDVATVEQPVEERGGHHLVAEDPAPLLEALFEVSTVEARP